MSNQQVPTTIDKCFLDYTYCASPKCGNKCGRKMSEEIEKAISRMEYNRVSMSYFCGGE